MNISILQLEKNKYFVGTTDYLYEADILKYFKKHTNEWLDTYPIVKVIKVIPIHYFGSTKEEKAIEKYYEVKKITDIMINRYSMNDVENDINDISEDLPTKSNINYIPHDIPIIKTNIKTNINYTTELEWYEEFERQQKMSSVDMFSSPYSCELYNNLEWNQELEKEQKSPFDMFTLLNFYDMEESMLKTSYL
jgi:hypothetical protein